MGHITETFSGDKKTKSFSLSKERKIGHYTLRTECRFCSSKKLTKVLDFGPMPLAGAFLKEEKFGDEEFFPLEVFFCENCSLVQICHVIPNDVLYKNYFYFSSSISTLVGHCSEWAKEVYDGYLKDLKNPLICEIGCNDGVMLKPFAKLGVRAIGVDPATNVVASVKQEGFRIINDCFNHSVANRIATEEGKADVILSSYSFAHFDEMQSAMEGINSLLKDDGQFIFEVYYLGTLLEGMQYDMIYHEHFSYYSLHALNHFLAQHGFEIYDTKFTPGVRSGAVRFYACRKHLNPVKTQSYKDLMKEEVEKGYNRSETFFSYGKKVEKTKIDLLNALDKLKAEGKRIVGYGASGRGTIIMNYCGIDEHYLDYVVDDAPAKHGYCTPGTHVKIKPGTEIDADRPDYALLFAWSFANEVCEKRKDYVSKGGKFIVPLPDVTIIPE